MVRSRELLVSKRRAFRMFVSFSKNHETFFVEVRLHVHIERFFLFLNKNVRNYLFDKVNF